MLYKNGSKNANTAYIVHCIECNSIKHFHDTRNDFFSFLHRAYWCDFSGNQEYKRNDSMYLRSMAIYSIWSWLHHSDMPYFAAIWKYRKHEKGSRNFRCLPSCQVHGPNIFFQEKHLPEIMSRLVEFWNMRRYWPPLPCYTN